MIKKRLLCITYIYIYMIICIYTHKARTKGEKKSGYLNEYVLRNIYIYMNMYICIYVYVSFDMELKYYY